MKKYFWLSILGSLIFTMSSPRAFGTENDYTGLLSGSYWGGIEVTSKPTIITFSFPTTVAPPAYITTLDDPKLTPAAIASFQGFTVAEQTLARSALTEWGDNSGLIFIEVAAGQGDINFEKMDFTGTGYAGKGGIGYFAFGDWQFSSYPSFTSDLDSSGDVIMNSVIPITYGTLLHEIGHTLGLKHPTEAWTNYAAIPPVVHHVWTVDDPDLTIMSQLSGGTGHLHPIDIEAIQFIYGTPTQDGTQVASYTWNATQQKLTQNGYATDDVIRGSSVIDIMNGNNGNDKLFGLNGNDTLKGGNGNDLLDGGPGVDRMFGGAGDDTYFVSVKTDKVIELADEGYDTVISVLSYTLGNDVEQLQLWGTVKLTGTGNASGNEIYGNNGGNTLSGLAGSDYIVGGTGKDKITGGADRDIAYGGEGADTFAFVAISDFSPSSLPDYIGDFTRTQKDKLDLKAIDPDPVLGGDQAFTFIGTAPFSTNTQYQLRYEVSGTDLLVQGDINHDRVADFSFLVHGATSLAASDFRL